MSKESNRNRIFQPEFYIVVDVEAAGPNPGTYALLSIGACTIEVPGKTFYIELKPDAEETNPEAMTVNQLSMERLKREGISPEIAMKTFAEWVEEVVPEGKQVVFTAFNAAFDWMFINDYFHKYLGYNPFGHSALDIKAYFMGAHGVNWSETSHKFVGPYYAGKQSLSHHALEDAVDEARIFQALLEEERSRKEATYYE